MSRQHTGIPLGSRGDAPKSKRAAARLRSGAALVACALALAGCDDDEQQPGTPRQQITDVVIGFYRDVVEGDIEAACDKLTGAGRAQAIGLPRRIGERPKPASEQQCLHRHHGLRDSTELPGIIENDLLRVRRVEIDDRRARAVTTAGNYDGVQRLTRTEEGWKLDLFDPMVHH
jgi:hypothetical protein